MSMTKPTAEQVTYKSKGIGAVERTVESKLADVVSVKDFGAVGDGVADDTAAIQAAIDWCMYRNLNGQSPGGSVYIPAGRYRTTDTIHLGYGGGTFRSIVVYGDGRRYRGGNSFAGTAIIADFNDRPAFAFTQTRYSAIESLSIIGKNFNWISSNQFGGTFNAPLIDDTVESNWVDPSFPASASSRYAPYCGVAIDPYAGTRPAVSYPDTNYPGWWTSSAQYGNGFSIMATLRDVEIGGFVVAVAVQPCDADGNGDYTRVLNCLIENCQYGISVGNTQSRDIALSDCEMRRCYGFITTSVHGRQAGKAGFDVRNCSFNFGTYLALISQNSLAQGSNIAFRNCYSEVLYGLGSFGAGSSGSEAGSIGFYECEWGFQGWGQRPIPTSIITIGGRCGCTFSGVRFRASFGRPEVQLLHLNCDPTNVSLINCETFSFDDPTYLYEKVAVNGTARIVIGQGLTRFANWSFRTNRAWNILTGSYISGVVGRVLNEYVTDGLRDIGLCVYGKWAIPAAGAPPISIAHPDLSRNKATAASVSQTGRTVTIDWTGSIPAVATMIQGGPAVGDVAIDAATATVFIVKSRTGFVTEMVAQNNLDANGNLSVTISASGTMGMLNCRRYVMGNLHWGDTSSSSATISNVVCNDNVSRNVNSSSRGVQAGDYVYTAAGEGRGVCSVTNSEIASVTSNSITVSGNCRRNATFVPLDIFVRAETANNT